VLHESGMRRIELAKVPRWAELVVMDPREAVWMWLRENAAEVLPYLGPGLSKVRSAVARRRGLRRV
jgi:hypothetical protein